MANGEEESPKPAGNLARKIIWILIAIAFVVIAAVFAKTMFFRPSPEPIGDSGADAGGTAMPQERGEVIEIGEYLTNLAKPNEESYIAVKVAVELDGSLEKEKVDEIREELNTRRIEMKQVIGDVLRARNRDDLSTESGLQGLRQEIRRANE